MTAITAAELRTRFAEALAQIFESEAFDVGCGLDDQADTIEIATDTWTLVIESWPDGFAFLALDDEPAPEDAAAQLAQMLADALPALAAVDRSENANWSPLLRRSGDPLSALLADALQR